MTTFEASTLDTFFKVARVTKLSRIFFAQNMLLLKVLSVGFSLVMSKG